MSSSTPPSTTPSSRVIEELGRELAEAPLRDGALDPDAIERELRRRRQGADPLQPAQPERRRPDPRAAGGGRRSRGPARRLGPGRRDPRAADAARRRARPLSLRLRGGGAARDRLLLGLEDVQPRRPAVRPDRHRVAAPRRMSSPRLPFGATHCGHLGAIASVAAFRDGDPWLDDGARGARPQSPACWRELLAERLPEVRYAAPRAGYLAWLDLRALELGDDPSEALLERGRVALSPGPSFGPPGRRLRPAQLRHLAGAAGGGGERIARAVASRVGEREPSRSSSSRGAGSTRSKRETGPLELFDAHTHFGRNDPDGYRQEPEELLATLAQAGARAVTFPMHEPGGYAAANEEALAAAAASERAPGRLLPGRPPRRRRRRGRALPRRRRTRNQAAPARRAVRPARAGGRASWSPSPTSAASRS